MKKILTAIIFCLILAVGACLRLRNLGTPDDYMYDEVYHVPTFLLMGQGDIRAYEWWHKELTDEFGEGTYVDWLHPPLAKLIQAGFYRLWGNHSWTWRAPGAIAGILLILMVYVLTRDVFPGLPGAGLIAALLVSVDGLAIAMSRIAMNDIFVTLFATLAIWAYWRHRHYPGQQRWLWLTALACGLACASKWSGFWLFPFFFGWELVARLVFGKTSPSQIAAKISFFALGAFLLYLLAYSQMFYLGHGLGHWLELHHQIITYQFNLEATHPYSSHPLQWPLGLKPVYLYHDDQTGLDIWNRPFYPTWYLALGCLIVEILTLSSDFYTAILWPRLTGKPGPYRPRLAQFCRCHASTVYCIIGYLALWTPWILSPRIMYFHHYLPALPLLWALSGATLAKLLDEPIKKATKLFGS